MVTLTFGPLRCTLDNTVGPYKKLVLVGCQLRAFNSDTKDMEKGLVIAEIVKDQRGDYYWQEYVSEKIHPSLEIHGMGRW